MSTGQAGVQGKEEGLAAGCLDSFPAPIDGVGGTGSGSPLEWEAMLPAPMFLNQSTKVCGEDQKDAGGYPPPLRPRGATTSLL